MARMKRLDLIEAKIEAAQRKVASTGSRYESAKDELKKLLEERDDARKEELIAAVKHSKRSYEDIIKYIKSR